jgi:hypothetical protein
MGPHSDAATSVRAKSNPHGYVTSLRFCDGCGQAKSDVELNVACDGTRRLCSECFEQARTILYTETFDHRIPVMAEVPVLTAMVKIPKIRILDSLARRIRNALTLQNRRP